MVEVLTDWGVLVDGVADQFLSLARLRHASIHFNPETYRSMRTDALAALKQLGTIIAVQFGAYGRQPWFIEGTPGAQFIKREYETDSFVRTYILPLSGFVGVEFGMDFLANGRWMHLDYHDRVLDDNGFATAFCNRDPTKVVTRQMIESGPVEGQGS